MVGRRAPPLLEVVMWYVADRVLMVLTVAAFAFGLVYLSIHAADQAYAESEAHGRRIQQQEEAWRP